MWWSSNTKAHFSHRYASRQGLARVNAPCLLQPARALQPAALEHLLDQPAQHVRRQGGAGVQASPHPDEPPRLALACGEAGVPLPPASRPLSCRKSAPSGDFIVAVTHHVICEHRSSDSSVECEPHSTAGF